MTDWTRHVVLITSGDGKRHGSGFVVRRAGAVAHVVTCAHVVSDLGDAALEANGLPAKVLWDGTRDGIDLAVLAAEGLTEEPLTLTRRAAPGDAVMAVGFTQVDRGRRATACPATIREATQLTYDPAKVVKKHAGWLLAVDGDGVTDGFSGGPVVAADTGLVIGVLGLRGKGTADAIGIGNLATWKDAPPAISGLSDEVERLKRASFRARALAFVLGAGLAAAVAVVATRREQPLAITPTVVWTGHVFGGGVVEPEDVVVTAAAGWQRSRQPYKAGDKVCVEPSGQVSVSHPDVEHLAEVWRALLVKHAPAGTKLAAKKSQVPPPVLADYNRFQFGWTGPEGQAGKDGLFDECRLAPADGWGALLMVELRELGYPNLETRDPLQLLLEDQRSLAEVRVLGGRREITFTSDAYLAFMVNDAVLSPRHGAAHPLCVEPETALAAARRALANDLGHQLGAVTAPLLPFIDNTGEFRVRIRKGACPAINVLRTRAVP